MSAPCRYARGLSPRMRGNPDCGGLVCGGLRSIPAYAGEPRRRVNRVAQRQVYPRVCGGTQDAGHTDGIRHGLSPRMRGNLPARAGLPAPPGSIPAYAGEPYPCRHSSHGRPVYPRVCGGTRRILRAVAMGQGLSPRMRGNPGSAVAQAWNRGSIPAYAGEPYHQLASSLMAVVYPRVCGGTRVVSLERLSRAGLSPRMRGNRERLLVWLANTRSIPAYAGEPTSICCRMPSIRVYPRVCGGTAPPLTIPCRRRGLSPRMRGNRGRLSD